MSFLTEVAVYVGRIRQFDRTDVLVYVSWVGLMFGLVLSSSAFLAFGVHHGVRFPAHAFFVPAGALLFALSIAVDTIGHRTIYREEIAGAEGLVHGITIFCGIGSCLLLCVAYQHPESLWIPALVLTVLSVIYSLVDELFHWRRYVQRQADRVEMWSHVGIMIGHLVMMLGWWTWFFGGYQGVSEVVALWSEGARVAEVLEP